MRLITVYLANTSNWYQKLAKGSWEWWRECASRQTLKRDRMYHLNTLLWQMSELNRYMSWIADCQLMQAWLTCSTELMMRSILMEVKTEWEVHWALVVFLSGRKGRYQLTWVNICTVSQKQTNKKNYQTFSSIKYQFADN